MTGNLLIRTYASNMLVPIEDVRVTVYKNIDGQKNIVAFRTTDENGKTNQIDIETPDIGQSLNPQNETIPFEVVNVLVEREGFEIAMINDVQIFPDRLSEQNVEMLPLPENSSFDEFYQEYTVTPQDL